ncbi:MAG: hypothetical protein AAF487_08095 [Bacteroidota bacterium]
MKYNFLIFLFGIFLFSCVKDEASMPCDNQNDPTPAQFPFGENAYWVYDHFKVSGLDTTYYDQDTLFVTGTIEADGESYTTFSTLVPFPSTLRQEGAQLYTPNNLWADLTLGQIIPLSNDTLFINEDPFVESFGYMSDSSQEIIVPAGSFNCFHRIAEYTAFDPDYPHGVRTDNYFIADSIGVVQFNYFYYSSPDNFFYQLVDFSL